MRNIADRFRDLKVSTRLWISSILPLLLLIVFGLFLIADAFRQSQIYAAAAEMADLAPAIGELVHELQKERGTSSGYIASQATQFETQLSTQQAVSDSVWRAFEARLAVPLSDNVLLQRRLNDVAIQLSNLPTMRARVETLDTSLPEMLQFYTYLISLLNSVLAEMSTMNVDGELSHNIHAFTALALAKERMGLERAAGTTRFAVADYANHPEQRIIAERLIEHDVAAGVHVEEFRQFANAEQMLELNKILQHPTYQEVADMRALARRSMASQVADPGTWFSLTTEVIDQVKMLQDHIGKEIQRHADDLSDHYRERLLRYSVSISIVALVTMLLTWLAAQSIHQPLARIMQAMQTLVTGSTDFNLEQALTRGDEVGDIARALEVFRENYKAMQRANEEQQAAQAALVDQSQEIMSLSTMVLDIQARIALVPVIGTLDDARASQLSERVLNHIQQNRTSIILLDVTGVAELSERVASFLSNLIAMSALMGCEVIITGVKPTVAKMLSDINPELGRANRCTATLEDGLSAALQTLRD